MLLLEKLKSYNIILASKSPRRRELMAGAGFEFRVADDYFTDESFPEDMDSSLVPEYIAHKKADAYLLELQEDDILITADTVVVLGSQVLGKPRDRAHATEMLSALSGNEHSVVTGVVIRCGERKSSFSAVTRVNFRRLSAQEIEYYVDTFKPYDKAGSYGIQEWIGYIGVESIQGSFFNVMGLPTQMLYSALDKFIV